MGMDWVVLLGGIWQRHLIDQAYTYQLIPGHYLVGSRGH